MRRLRKMDIDRKRGLFWFLDFDGTIADFVNNPQDAIVRPSIKRWLKKLLAGPRVKVAVVTGRGLDDIRCKLRLQRLYYLANHGLEIFHEGQFLLKRGRQFRKPLEEFGDRLETELAHIPGILVENKGLSVAIHFRQVAVRYHRIIRTVVCKAARPFEKHNLQLTPGKHLLELRPALFWNKGRGVLWLWKKIAPRFFPVYVGDDVTDEDAFRALRHRGLTIRVGKKTGSSAKYYTPSIQHLVYMVTTGTNCGISPLQ